MDESLIIEICKEPRTVKEIYELVKPDVSFTALRLKVYRMAWKERKLLRFYDKNEHIYKYIAMKYIDNYLND